MNKAALEALKSLSREERKEYFESHKAELFESALRSVNGGAAANGENPTSEVPYGGNWISSPGFICEGEVQC